MSSPRSVSRRTIAIALVAIASVAPSRPIAASDHIVADGWSSIVTLRTPEGGYASAVHMSLRPDGKLLAFGIRRSSWPPAPGDVIRRVAYVQTPQPYGSVLPSELVVTQVGQPVEHPYTVGAEDVVLDDLVCSGHTLLADGSVFTAGGTRFRRAIDGSSFASNGLPSQTRYAGTSWTRLGDMVGTPLSGRPDRWYPTLLRLPDKRVLIISGFDKVLPTPSVNLTTELFDPVTQTNATASPFGVTPPEVVNSDYTHAWVLPFPNVDHDILMFGELGIPVLNDTDDFTSWDVRRSSKRPGATGPTQKTNHGTGSAMLPLRVTNGEWGYNNGSVLMAGGTMNTPFVSQIDVYDPVAGSWLPSLPMPGPRHHPNSIVLPDGRILLLGGHNMDGDDTVQKAVYIDPADGFSVSVGSASAGITRGYHTTTALLPDGRVLISGGRDAVTSQTIEKPSYQYYEPDYMRKPRPQLVSAPAALDYGGLFSTGSIGPKPAEAVLVSLASQTHSFDANQRVIELPVGAVFDHANGGYVSIIGDPVNTHQVPPGQYMLFLLDENRVPSVASMVSVQP